MTISSAIAADRPLVDCKLDAMMAAPPDFKPGTYKNTIHEMREFADAKMGQYAHINEPAHHVLYLWLFAGQPWKTQHWVREVMDRLYKPTPDGLCGDEDTGQMSAWYVWNAIGLYPFCPGHPSYVIGSPLFPRIAITLQGGKTFTVIATGNGPGNRYIQSATLNGKPLAQTWIAHEDLIRGGTLTLEMGPKPDEHWGMAAGTSLSIKEE
jgi:predicted alpha-1,2-mannosidase